MIMNEKDKQSQKQVLLYLFVGQSGRAVLHPMQQTHPMEEPSTTLDTQGTMFWM